MRRKKIDFVKTKASYRVEISENWRCRSIRPTYEKKCVVVPCTYLYKRLDNNRTERRNMRRKHYYKEISWYRIKNHNWSVHKVSKDGLWYKSYTVYGSRYLAHRLVARAFLWLNIKDTEMLVCHKDDNPENNHYNNLFLGCAAHNLQDMARKFRSLQKLTKEDVLDICRRHSNWESIRSIQRAYSHKVSFPTVYKHIKQKHLHGFKAYKTSGH